MSAKALKILIVTDAWYPQVNGVVGTLAHTKSQLERLGHEVHMLTPQPFVTIPCPTYPEIRLSMLPKHRVAQIIKTVAPNAIHIATEGPLGLAARGYAKRHGLAFTSAYHTRFPEYVRARTHTPLKWSYAFVRWFHSASSVVMAPTESVISDLKSWGISNIEYWPRGVDLDMFTPAKNRVPNKQFVFLYVGRLAVEKNLEAFLRLDLPGEKWVVGGGPAKQDLQRKYPDAKFFGVQEKENLPSYYQQADVFVFPSKTDTFGLVLLEGMACGLPVAAYPVSGPIDVVGASGAGVLSDDLGAACMQALEIPRADVRAHAENFSWEAATKLFLQHQITTDHIMPML